MNMDIGGIVPTGENRNTERKPEHIFTFFSLQIPHRVSSDRAWAHMVRGLSRRNSCRI